MGRAHDWYVALHLQAGLIEDRKQSLEGPAQDIYDMEELRVGAVLAASFVVSTSHASNT
jgi:hypothetical protein